MITGKSLNKIYRDRAGKSVHALLDVNFTIGEGEFYVLLGPSGSGKTTTLRTIAGLEHPDDGEIFLDGKPVFIGGRICIPAERRPIAMVFQSYALWPHMNVFDNISFPLKHGINRIKSDQVKARVLHSADLLGIVEYLDRPISQLSGGQQQRVALARALALQPRVLLMDEPLSNLDARLRGLLRVELKALTRSIGITTIYVTHDQTEAMVMGDRIAVMQSGRFIQEGSPRDLYERPQKTFVAKFLGDMNFLNGRLKNLHESFVEVSIDQFNLCGLAVAGLSSSQISSKVSFGFRPEDVSLVELSRGSNGLPAVITGKYYTGEALLYQLESAGHVLQVRASKDQSIEIGSKVFMEIAPSSCLVFQEN